MSQPHRPHNPDATRARPVVALVEDLFFGSKISGTGAALGVPVVTVRSHAALLDELVHAAAVIIDLMAAGSNPAALITAVKQRGPQLPVLAFLPHVEAELARAARHAGADRVLTRSQFTDRLPGLLREIYALGADPPERVE